MSALLVVITVPSLLLLLLAVLLGSVQADTGAEFFTADELADILKISKRHLYRLVDRGAAPKPVRLGAAVRWHRETVLRWIADGCPKIAQSQKSGEQG